MQTPQVFRPAALLDAYNRAEQEGFSATDDAGVLERYGYKVRVVEGRPPTSRSPIVKTWSWRKRFCV